MTEWIEGEVEACTFAPGEVDAGGKDASQRPMPAPLPKGDEVEMKTVGDAIEDGDVGVDGLDMVGTTDVTAAQSRERFDPPCDPTALPGRLTCRPGETASRWEDTGGRSMKMARARRRPSADGATKLALEQRQLKAQLAIRKRTTAPTGFGAFPRVGQLLLHRTI